VHDVVELPVYGLPHSFNVATAAAMALYEYARQVLEPPPSSTAARGSDPGPARAPGRHSMTPRTADVAVVRLTLALLRRGALALVRELDPPRKHVSPLRRAFACSGPEVRFARALLERHTNLWLLRTDQRAFSGDFVLIDLSSPRPEARATLVLELKCGEPARRVGAARHQVRNAALAVAAAARSTGAIPEDAPHDVWLGDAEALLVILG
jgi:hypothetical protein